MTQLIKVKFKEGAFVPDEPVSLTEGTSATVMIDSSLEPPLVQDKEARRALRHQAVDKMIKNPVPLGAPRFKREDFYEDRMKRYDDRNKK